MGENLDKFVNRIQLMSILSSHTQLKVDVHSKYVGHDTAKISINEKNMLPDEDVFCMAIAEGSGPFH